jgi:hypothetical protein
MRAAKAKQAKPAPRLPEVSRKPGLFALRWSHINAGKFQRIAVNGAFYDYVMTSMLGDLSLIVDGVYLPVCVVDKNVLGAVLYALDGALARAIVGSLRAAVAISDVTRPAVIGGHGQPGQKKPRSHSHCKTRSHKCFPSKSRLIIAQCIDFGEWMAGLKTRHYKDCWGQLGKQKGTVLWTLPSVPLSSVN